MRKKKLAGTLALFALAAALSCGGNVKAFEGEELAFSQESGYYKNAFSLTISVPEGADNITKILYTLDGSEPREGDPSTKQYTEPISVKSLKGNAAVLTTNDNAYEFVDGWAGAYTPSVSKLDRAFIVRAAGVKDDGTLTKISTRSYFVSNDIKNEYKNCAVMSIVTDPDNLIDGDKGIYVKGNTYNAISAPGDEDLKNYANFMQSGKEWERAAYVDFFDGKDTAEFSQGIGIRIHGGYSRRNQQKSLNVYFRDTYDYGTKNLKGYELFPDIKQVYDDKNSTYSDAVTNKFKSVMLRNGGNDVDYTKFQDAFIQQMVSDKNFTTQGARPCMLYLNGEYWGLYNLTEKYSDKYLEEKFGVSDKNIMVYKDLELDEGEDPDGAALKELMDLGNLDMTKEENYQKFLDLVDVDSFVDYYATEVYINNNDWWSGCNAKTPNNNICFWKVADPSQEVNADGSVNPFADGKWRYMLFDTEWSMSIYNSTQAGPEYDSIKYHALGEVDKNNSADEGRTQANGSPVFRAVFKNADFRKRFFTALLDIRNYNFNPSRCSSVLNAYSSLYSPLMEKHRIRWNTGEISQRVSSIKSFISKRQDYSLTMIENNSTELTKEKRVNVEVLSNVADRVTVNSIEPEITDRWFQGVYYKEYPVSLKAKDVEGYSFDRWDITGAEIIDGDKQEITVKFTSDKAKLVAMYKEESGAEPTLKPTPEPTPTPTPAPTRRPGWGWGDIFTPAPSVTPSPTKAPTEAPTKTSAPTNTPAVNNTQAPASQTAVPVVQTQAPDSVKDEKVTEFVVEKLKYKVIASNEVAVTSNGSIKTKNVVIPPTVKYKGVTYKVTEIDTNAFKSCKTIVKITVGSNIRAIGKNAFMNCKKLKTINVKSKKIKLVSKGCLKGINKKAVIRVPKAKKSLYSKLFAKKGQKSTVLIK